MTTQAEAATWHTALEMVRQVERSMAAPMPPGGPLSAAYLERLAADLLRLAPQLEGEMPLEVETLIRRHGAPGG